MVQKDIMKNQQIIESLRTNLIEAGMISDIQPIWREGSLEGSDILDGIIITLDDSVKTELRINVWGKNQLNLQLSQLEMAPTRKVYAQNE